MRLHCLWFLLGRQIGAERNPDHAFCEQIKKFGTLDENHVLIFFRLGAKLKK